MESSIVANKPLFVILTGVSGSGKSTIVNRLLKEGFSQPLHYTTRQPRNDRELDEYVFLTKEQFLTKLENNDFAEYTMYNGNWYALGAHFSTTIPQIAILEPVGASSVKKFLKMNKMNYISIFLEIDEATMVERLGMMRGESVKVIEERKKDLLYFSPEGYTYVVDGKASSEEVYHRIKNILKTNGVC